MCMRGCQTEDCIGQWVNRRDIAFFVRDRLTVPSLLAGTPSRSTVRRISSRPPSTSPFCGPRCRSSSRCVMFNSTRLPLVVEVLSSMLDY